MPPGSGLPPGSSSRLLTAPKPLQRPHVLNFSVLIKLLNSCHITPGHQEDSFASMFICNSLAIYTLHIHTGYRGNAPHLSSGQTQGEGGGREERREEKVAVSPATQELACDGNPNLLWLLKEQRASFQWHLMVTKHKRKAMSAVVISLGSDAMFD